MLGWKGPSGITEPCTGHPSIPPVPGGFHIQNWGKEWPSLFRDLSLPERGGFLMGTEGMEGVKHI